jgi:small ligand-binding sensory domain FIST
MQFFAALSRQRDTDAAIEEILAQVQQSGITAPDFAALFVTYHHNATVWRSAARLRETLRPQVMAGCTACGVIGVQEEIEEEPGISLLLGSMPGVQLTPFHLGESDWDALIDDPHALSARVGTVAQTRAYMLLCDGYTTPIVELLEAFDSLKPRAPVFGGLASGAFRSGQNVLVLDDMLHYEGAVGVAFSGPVSIQTVVSQGCRPIGRRMLVTAAQDNTIATLSRRPALEVAEEMFRELSEEERRLLTQGVFLGVAMNEHQAEFHRGDFLIRNVVGVNQQDGGILVTDYIRAGQTVQFHVRDASTADEDLRQLMLPVRDNAPPAGGLLFSCNGRGRQMFPLPHHDIQTVLNVVPQTPIAGLFAQGEIGPVGGRSFVHGHTASIVFFRPLNRDE